MKHKIILNLNPFSTKSKQPRQIEDLDILHPHHWLLTQVERNPSIILCLEIKPWVNFQIDLQITLYNISRDKKKKKNSIPINSRSADCKWGNDDVKKKKVIHVWKAQWIKDEIILPC